jgi:hydroxyethylthiazole kinase-like uncharacterized protein yjeF
MDRLTTSYIKSCLKQRETTSNKSDHGHALVIAGSRGYMGAAVIAAKAAVRTGTGLLTVCVPAEERFIVQTSVPESMVLMREEDHYPLERFSAIGIGPGIGVNELSEEMLAFIIVQAKIPLVLDADALTILSGNKMLLSSVPEKTIITPHTGEFDRLFGVHQTNEERMNTARIKAGEYQITIVLKGPNTAIITADEVCYNTTGNAGLAKGGSGDALTGIITSFMAQGYEPIIAAKMGVYLHGLAADITLQEQSMESMLITDVINNFGKAFESIRTGSPT